ncbi:hypothetical protein [Erythrobacter colymbi]|uniref:hypothetical protein n=1 Tax=Erythrobacter colymbi TaxID=1161202 RepID=UPI000A3960EE|nr:hypothetical protein [Erythrobacter colymbi]
MRLPHPARLLLAALAVSLSAPSIGQEAEPAPPSPQVVKSREEVTIPFAPPLDTPQAYRLRFERKFASSTNAIELEQRLTFAKIDGGYALTIEQLAINSGDRRLDLSDRRALDAVPPGLRVYLLPVVVELDSAGEMVRLRDWPTLQESLRAFPEAAAGFSGKPVNEGAVAAMRTVLEPFINSTAEEAPRLLIRGWPAMLGYGGSIFTAGETLASDVEVPTPFSPTPIPAVSQGSVSRTPDAHISLVQTTVFDPEVIHKLTLGVIDRMRSRGALKGPLQPADAILGLELTDEIAITFDPVTGLPISGRTTRLANVTTPDGPQGGGEITTITRIAP